MITLETLHSAYRDGSMDTVLVCMVDMQGRLMGKRFHVSDFLENAHEETHCCDYLLATDLEMATPDGYASSSWKAGYGDYVMRPDLDTLRPIPWLEGTAMVLCDVLDHHTHEEVAHSPRSVLKRQVTRLEAMGLVPMMATELEFFLFEKSLDELRADRYRDMKPLSGYSEDYHILQTTKEEHVMRPVRNHLRAAGIPVENSKGEAGIGQEELNIRYAPAMDTADHHTIAKHAIKEIAWQNGRAATFIAKWSHEDLGSSSHVHQSLWQDGGPAFFDEGDPLGMSPLMKHYVAGLVKYAPDCTYFLAPYVNSYKRFVKSSFAPTRIIWSVDNRTAGFRLCGANTGGVRIECRIGGSDMQPHLALAAQLAAGIRGIEEQLELAPPAVGDIYADDGSGTIPATLRDAREALTDSAMLRAALGHDVVDHYARAAQWELEEFDRVVTDYEVARGFERA